MTFARCSGKGYLKVLSSLESGPSGFLKIKIIAVLHGFYDGL